MTENEIKSRLNRLSDIADRRKNEADLNYLPNHNSISFLTEDEKTERYELIKQLPSSGQRIKQAGERIKERIRARK